MRCINDGSGEALKRENVSGYNCSYIAVDSLRAFDELIVCVNEWYRCRLLSVERQFVNKLPTINEEFHDTDTVIIVSQIAKLRLGEICERTYFSFGSWSNT